jgi:hypothetical protein
MRQQYWHYYDKTSFSTPMLHKNFFKTFSNIYSENIVNSEYTNKADNSFMLD